MTDRILSYTAMLFLAAAQLQGCVDSLSETPDGGMQIEIGGTINSPVLSVKSDARVLDYDTAGALDINIIRWDQSDGNTSTAGRDEMSAQMGSPAQDGTWKRKITFAEPQFYLNKTDSVGFAGWYPDATHAGWVLENGKTIHSDNTMTFNIDGTTDVLISDFTGGTYNSKLSTLTFNHALCMFNIYAYTVDEETRNEWGKLQQVTLTNLPTQLIVNLPDDIRKDNGISFTFNDGNSERQLLQDNTLMELPVGSPSLNVGYVGTVLGGAPKIGVLGISVDTEAHEDKNSISIARNFKSGYAYNIFLRFSTKGVINAEVSVSEWEYNGKDYDVDQNLNLLTNLSRYGTSNCYIVSSGNRGYCFDGTVKGNGVNTLTRRDGTVVTLPDRDVTLNVDHVEILRSDAMMKLVDGKMEIMTDMTERATTPLIELVSDKLSDGKVVFKVIGNKNDAADSRLPYRGNVKIGAFDAAGNIIWSWHIWVTDPPANQGYSNGYVALDRNLGAVTDDYSTYVEGMSHWSGLYYQWGRKDPIFRATVEEGHDPWKPEVRAEAVSVMEAHRNPTVYFYDPAGNHWTTDTENNDCFWGYTSVRNDIRKTIYDPCPPGYRVTGNPIWEDTSPNMTHSRAVNQSDGSFAGYLFNISGMIQIYYPGTICIVDGQVKYSDRISGTSGNDEFVYQYSATPYEPALYGQTDEKYNGLAYHFRYNGEELGPNYSSVLVADPDLYNVKRSTAFPVRCVFENSAPVVTDLSEIQSANSYVVSKTGFYKFKANLRGNGVTALHIVDGSSTVFRNFDAALGANIGNAYRVDVLWWQGDLAEGSSYRTFAERNPSSDEIGSTCPVTILDEGRLVDGEAMIYVKANEETYGNVGLAVYDANDNILWSWHIWIQPGIRVASLGEYTLMDRNLGATWVPSSDTDMNNNEGNFFANLGLYYQWGRKDPFFPPAGRNTTNTSTYYWFEKTTSGWERRRSNNIAEKSSIQNSVQNPLSFYRSGNTYWQTTYTAADGPVNDLWGYVGANGVMGNSFAKTMWDPCPPGYRVMQHNVFLSANICQSENNYTYRLYNNSTASSYYYSDFGLYLYNGMGSYGNWSPQGYGTTTRTINAGGIWFPNSGVINSLGYFNMLSSHGARISTATPFSGEKTREIRWTGDNSYYTVSQDNDNNWMCDGRVVRCQME